MLNKLIKIDLRFILKYAPIFFGIGLFFALVSLIPSKLESSTILEVIKSVSENFALSASIGGAINILARAVVTFKRKLYGDESYLTHTLPLSKETIYFSKMLSLIYSFLIALFSLIFILSINYNLFENFDSFKLLIETTAGITGGSVPEFLILLILVFISESITIISIIFLALILKNRLSKTKTGLIIAGTYLLIQGAFLLVIFLLGLLNPEIMELFKNSELVSTTAIKTIFYSGIVVYLAASVILNYLNIKLLKKGVNVA